MSKFTKPLRHQRDGNRFTTIEPFGFYGDYCPPKRLARLCRQPYSFKVDVPIGAYGDGASVPYWLQTFFVLAGILILDSLPGLWNLLGVWMLFSGLVMGHPYGCLFKAAVLHDDLYNSHQYPRYMADFIFRDAAKVDSAQSPHWRSHTLGRALRWFVRWQAWIALRLFAFVAYNNSHKKEIGRRVDQQVAAEVNRVLFHLNRSAESGE